MSNGDPRGQFVWHELLTGDAGAASAFYTKVVPWKTQPWDKDSSYSMWVAKNGPVGGIASLGESSAPKWLAYIGVNDVEGTLESAKSLGGRVLKGATEIPNGGVYALLADPQGAEFGIYKSSQPSNGESAGGAGDFTWHELATSDAKAAMEFYTKLFGWEVGPVHDMGGPAGNYHLFLRGGNQYGGMYTNTDAGGPNWLCYIGVEDAGKAANAVKTAGGRVLNGPMEVPGGSWVAMALDSEGVAFAVHEQARAAAAKPAESPAAKPKKKGGAASSITKPPEASGGGAASSITKPPQAKGGGAASSITKPPQATATGGGAAGGAASSVTKPPKKKAAAKKAAAKAPAKAPAKKAKAKVAAKKGKKAAKGKAVAKKAAGKKKSAAKRAPAKKKASRAKAKKRR